ncbi:hypothetical protein BCS96_16550 [Vibrio breoganii]|uniref:energy transducer TonB n=1 Tax=Vibrio breoganii TaxID=553239 RepID=UPI000C8480FB|nr:energy transducer TonB [Vibrio breoganii]PMG89666.1 hypothetical protein BCU81_07870 [Vibrio breoganii]PMK19632.1 hypothetical protein BCU06_07710 [Vibrio breoganii]PML15533.1 hypothetical protein BCT84_09045 [Vibrio breoganii]PML41770.1 hypothetical protein BCT78_17370 [Vibrio breoganii]PML79636.1 hypothetical protein BCT68_16260 [Vibrio breoganii]
MKKYRYLLAGGVSLLIHGVALSFSAPRQEISLASNNEGHAVSIKFVSLAQPEKKAEKKEVKPQPPAPKEIETKKEAVEKPQPKKATPKPVAKPKKKVEKKSPVSKPVEPQAVKTAKTEPKPKAPEKIEPTPKEKPVETKHQKEAAEPQTASTNAASASKPKMVKKPTFSAKPTPVNYPRLAQKRGWQGSTLVEIWINEQGKQIKQTVVNSSGHKLLDEAALNAVSDWQFQRRNEQGQRIAYRVQVPINFQLN